MYGPLRRSQRGAPPRSRTTAVLAALLLAGGLTSVVAVVGAPAALATSQQVQSISQTCGGWTNYAPPANTVGAIITLRGGGGGGGGADSGGGTPGSGGGGGVVSTTVTTGLPGATSIALTIGCGGGGGQANGNGGSGGTSAYGAGGNGGGSDEGGGAGGGSTALCVGSSGCTIALAVAPGGGGGGSIYRCCIGYSPQGGNGGNAGSGTTTGSNGGNASNCGGICNDGGGGGGATVSAVGTAQGYGSGNNGSGTNGGAGGPGADNIGGGGGGGGRFGGAGGGGGNNTTSSASGGGGGAGSSYANSGSPSYAVDGTKTTVCGRSTAVCTNAGGPGQGGSNSTNNNTGYAGSAGSASITWIYSQPPVGANQTTGNATKGVGLGITLSASDPDADNPVSCTVVTGPGKGSLNSTTTCTPTYTAAANQSGNDTFTYRVTDSLGVNSTATYTVTIPIVNRPPTGAAVVAPGASVNKGQGNAVNLANTDPDGDNPLTCAITVAPTKATIASTSSCAKTLTPNANTIGADSFSYTVSDAHGGTSTSYVVNYTIANRNPTGANQVLSVDAGTALPIALANTDPDLVDTLTCAIPSAPTKGALTGTGCTRTYTSNAGPANNGVGGADSFTYAPQDQNGGVGATQTIALTVNNPNLTLVKAHTGRFQPGTGTGTYTLTLTNSNVAVANGTTTIVDALPAGMLYRSSAVGSSGFTCVGTAGVSTTVTCTRPTAIAKSSSTSLAITVDVAESAGSPISNVAVVSSPYELSTTAADNTATDSTLVNHRPVASPLTVATEVDSPVLLTLPATDPDGDALTYSIVSAPANGVLSGSGATRQYTADSGFQGIDTFTFRATDNEGLQSAVQTAKVYVGVSTLKGTVTNEVGGAALPGITVYLVDNSVPSNPDPALVATATTDGSGQYDLGAQFPATGSAVPHGSYVIRFYDATNDFISEWNADASSRASATNVAVSSASPTIAVNAALTPGARIQGTVRSTAGGNPTVGGLQVRLYKIGSTGSSAVTTSVAGQYRFELLRAGTYQLWFRDVSSGQWRSEWYDEATSQATSTTITVTVGQQLLVDESVAPIVPVPPPTVGSVTGTVRSAGVGNAPLAGIQVRLYAGPTYETSRSTTTDGNGQYAFTDVVAGSYKLWFRALSGSPYASEYATDRADLASADPVAVGAGTTVVDALLTPATPAPPANSAVVSGTVTQLDGVTPIAGIQVRLYVAGNPSGSVATTTDGNGQYAFTGRAPGSYQVWFRDLTATWFGEWNLDEASQAGADAVSATNATTTIVDASLTAR